MLYKMAPVESEWCIENFMYNILDNSKVKRDLDYKYTVHYEQGVRLCFDYLSKNNLIENSDNFPFYDTILERWKKFEYSIIP